jgi:integrase
VHRSPFYRIFSAAAKKAGLPAERRHPHCLKHTLGFAQVGANVNLAFIKQALGHKSIARTAIYTVPTDESAGKAVLNALASTF